MVLPRGTKGDTYFGVSYAFEVCINNIYHTVLYISYGNTEYTYPLHRPQAQL